jgi:hypothetical protein
MSCGRYGPDVNRRAHAMPKRERRAYLQARGWERIGNAHGGETWMHPEHRALYSLAAATRRQLAEEATA